MEKIICLICTYSLNSIHNVYLILVYRFLWWLWCWSDMRNVILKTLNAVLKSVTHFLSHIKISHYVCTHCYCFYTALLKIFFIIVLVHFSSFSDNSWKQFVLLSVRTLNSQLPLYSPILHHCFQSIHFLFFLICIK